MNRKFFYLSLVAIAITGCSNTNKKQANGDFEYAEKQEAKNLTIPQGLHAPKRFEDYAISNDINHQGPIGKNVDVRAPSLVLPVAASTRVESTNSEAKIWFDQVLDDVQLKSFIVTALEEQLTSDGVALEVVDAENDIYESQWYNVKKESGWLIKDIKSTESYRYRYTFESKPHGRSVALKVALVDYLKTDSEKSESTEIDLIDKQRAEIAMLNQVISQVDYKYRKQAKENRLLRANQKLVSIGENAESQPAYIVEMELDLLWSNMPIFFEDHGFTVSDLNESKKIYYVDFVKPDFGLWDMLWGDDKPIIEIEDGKYQFILQTFGEDTEQTSVTILDEQGNVLSSDVLNAIFDVIEPGLSFRGL